MGRKSLAEERTEQILDAFEVCIRKYGFEGSSLARIAEEAGVQRSIIRHYIGNRDQLVKAAIKRLILNYRQSLEDAITNLPKEDFIRVLLDYLFLEYEEERSGSELLLDSLWAKQESDPYVKALLTELYQALEDLFTEGLGYAHPNASPDQCRDTAYALICMVHSHSSLYELGLGKVRSNALRQLADKMVSQLASA